MEENKVSKWPKVKAVYMYALEGIVKTAEIEDINWLWELVSLEEQTSCMQYLNVMINGASFTKKEFAQAYTNIISGNMEI